ncbi:MAG TPA: histidine--tRNA ligase [Anaerolineales bacterium]|nr:histidine--tRNA ligase [Anaerolineales bacterium]
MKKIIQSVKGTRDFYPEQMAIRIWLYNQMRAVAESFGYQEYEAPILETLELYAAKSGEELVKEQSYVFTDRGGSEITLRPELTPSLARMIAQKQNELTFPVRWWSFGPFWRYERPQKGRTREFFQWNVDMLGVSSPEADAENAAVLATFFQRVGLSPQQVLILVNNRRLIDDRFDAFNVPAEKRPAVSSWIDRREKLSPEAWMDYGKEIGLSPEQITNLKEMLADKNLWKQSTELTRFFAVIEALGLRQYFEFDPSIMRGLLYYTGTVFEAWEVGGEIRRSILGGGRYDNLTRDVGGDPVPAVGFAMGDVVITLILEKYGLLPKDLNINPAPVLVTVFDEDRMLESFQLASELRRAGLKVVCYPEATKLQKQFKYADRIGAKVTLVLGPDEVENGLVAVKNLLNGEQVNVARDTVADTIRRILNA